jgi:hypothetical protein
LNRLSDPRIKGGLRDLQRLEAVVDKAKENALAFVLALQEIHAEGLYLLTHKSWESYCRLRHGFSRTRGYQLLRYVEVVGNVPEIENENQARVLDRLSPSVQAQVMKRALQNGKTDSAGLRAALTEICDEHDQRSQAVKKEWKAEEAEDLIERAIVHLQAARRSSCRPALTQVDPKGRLAQAIDGSLQVAQELMQALAPAGRAP